MRSGFQLLAALGCLAGTPKHDGVPSAVHKGLQDYFGPEERGHIVLCRIPFGPPRRGLHASNRVLW